MAGFWSPIDSEEKRARLSFLGGGAAVVIGGLWAAFIYFYPPRLDTSADKGASASVISRDFLSGRWQVVDKVLGVGVSSGSIVDYRSDGTFSGYWSIFSGTQGRKEPIEGKWDVTKISDNTYKLVWLYSVIPPEWKQMCPAVPCQRAQRFKVIDRSHIQNIDENYLANRIE